MAEAAASRGLYPARPTIEIDGEPERELSDAIRGLRVAESVNGVSSCELTVTNWGNTGRGVGFVYFDRRVLDFGKEIAVRMGADDAESVAFTGRISALEGRFPKGRSPEIRVLAEDRLQDLRMTRRTRAFEDKSDREIFEAVARDHGLSPDVQIEGPVRRIVAQVNQSDLAFLCDRARLLGVELWVEGARMRVRARSARDAGEVTLRHGQRLQQLSVRADLVHQTTGWTVAGWDVQRKDGVSHESDESVIAAELRGDLSGGAILEDTLGGRKQRAVHLLPADAAEAREMSEAAYRRTARRFVTGSGVAEGDGRIRVGTRLVLEGIGELFEGTYYVTEVEHTFDLERGLTTTFSVERPGIGRGGA